jgi:transmembrane sensor
VIEEIVRVLQGHASQAEVAEVEEWRDAHPENARRFREISALWEMTGVHDEIRAGGGVPTAAGLLARSSSKGGVTARSRAFPRTWGLGIAASVVLLAGIGYLTLTRSSGEIPTTEFRAPAHAALTATLSDGSVVRLSPGASLGFAESDGARIASLEGTAYFSVVHQENRPFVVTAGEGAARVLGTRFELEVDGGSLGLTVVDGSVRLTMGEESGVVGPGQRGEVSPGGEVRIQEVSDIFASMGWIGDFVAFESTTLRRVAEELEARFGIEVEVSSSMLLDRTITAWFEETRVDEILDVVCRVASVRCELSGTKVTISP